MYYGKNPFDDLYVSETIPPEQYVTLFSPALVNQAQALFQPGNVILQGVQGSGKTMLLSLLKPSVRIAYHEADDPFPVDDSHARFIAAGINLRKSPALDFGQRPIDQAGEDVLPLYFGDFLNYWIVADLLDALDKYRRTENGGIAYSLGLDLCAETLDSFAEEAAEQPGWFGYLDSIDSFVELKQRVKERIQAYRAFLNYNTDRMPSEIRASKTAIGVAISQTARALRTAGVIGGDVNVLVRIDQYEELGRLEHLREGQLGSRYAAVVNKALALRDPDVFFRIGTRKYAWKDEHLEIYGTSSVLEEERDFTVVDLEEILQRRENEPWIFPDFAEDVLQRRVQASDRYQGTPQASYTLKSLFGHGLSPKEEAMRYAGGSPERVIASEVGWRQSWTEFLQALAQDDPLSAKLGEAWVRQRGGKRMNHDPPQLNETPYPWEENESWKSERKQQALFQIAYLCNERKMWGGKNDILTLSGENILIFVSLCRHIWASWLRATHGGEGIADPPSITVDVQSVGIQIASRYWFDKIPEWSDGAVRQRFITLIGKEFRERLVKDARMSYPGHNGFSVVREELQAASREVRDFLADAVNFGDLKNRIHTSKKKQDRRERVKFYIKPVLSPHFQIPATHVKEPLYIDMADIRLRIDKAKKGEVQKLPGPFEHGATADDIAQDEQLRLLTDQ